MRWRRGAGRTLARQARDALRPGAAGAVGAGSRYVGPEWMGITTRPGAAGAVGAGRLDGAASCRRRSCADRRQGPPGAAGGRRRAAGRSKKTDPKVA